MSVNAWYPSGLAAVLSGDVDVLVDTIKVALVSATYVYSSAHDFYNDVTGVVGTPVALAGKAVSGGELSADDTVFVAVGSGSTVTGLVVYRDSGVAGTSALLGYICRQADTVPISRATTGGDITIAWPAGRVLKI